MALHKVTERVVILNNYIHMYLVVAKIFPPTFSLTQSFLEGASGVGTSVVLLRVKSVGSLICVLAAQSGLSREGRSGVLGMLDAEWAELRESESASASGLGESPATSGSSESVCRLSQSVGTCILLVCNHQEHTSEAALFRDTSTYML